MESMTEQIGRITLDLTHYPGEDLYCDGRVEDELLEIVKSCPRDGYQKIIEEKRSWPILYHLSPLRENIADWIPMEPDARVLEVGSGCGAVTGALARKAGQVTCVDLSRKRSLINAHRHSDCGNISIYVGNFKDIEPDLPADFDYIFLIGVFEYGQSYMGSDKPFEEFLSVVMKHLAPGGRVVIAIENKYGLKYFAGCREDHLGTFFSGIENYADGGGVRTFSRRGLEKIFAACGADRYTFYYPYPDYKFMTALYSDDYLPGKGELSDNLRNFDRDRMLLFDEKNAFDGIVEDELFSVFANSYEVVIGDGFDVKYTKYSNDRAPGYRIRTEICRDGEGRSVVNKYPLGREAEEHILGMETAYRSLLDRYEGGNIDINRCALRRENGTLWASFEFLEGRLLSELLDERLEKDDIDGFYALFQEYVERTGYRQEFPAADFDLIFGNIMVQGDTWTIIDYEWTFEKSVEAKELAFRAVYCYLLENEKRSKLDPDRMLRELGITQEDAERYRIREKEFQRLVTGQRRSLREMRDLIGEKVMDPEPWVDRYKENERLNRVQIYEDAGSGFSEEHSYFVPEAYEGEQEVELTLAVDGNVRVLRIDPSMAACTVQITEMTFNGRTVPLHNKKIFYTNGRLLRSSSTAVFATADPNLYVNVAALDRKAENILYVKMQVVRLPLSIAAAMAGTGRRFLREG